MFLLPVSFCFEMWKDETDKERIHVSLSKNWLSPGLLRGVLLRIPEFRSTSVRPLEFAWCVYLIGSRFPASVSQDKWPWK